MGDRRNDLNNYQCRWLEKRQYKQTMQVVPAAWEGNQHRNGQVRYYCVHIYTEALKLRDVASMYIRLQIPDLSGLI